ncbi:universal stress protein [Robiginitalea marina]|uniref:Universal stress protein n=1 Tax=Robiginitalea marina TaxID=2954105 RepID=A0ABT1AVQ2_9FLAO|nr:universal stress protein [Robiginitalea marina]MCO5723283.1 universal stress protein [Robiginitalea marina]
MKTILYATDYSENSAPALQFAYRISKVLNARLLAIHVFDYPTILQTEVQEPFPHLEEDAFKAHTRRLKDFCRSHLGEGAKVEIEALEHKNVREAIAGKALEEGASLLVVGMKGGSALRELLMGNTTKKLIEEAPCPVLSIPGDASFNGLETIVYATDFEEEDIAVLRELAPVAAAFQARIRAVHIASDKEYANLQRREWFQEALKKELPEAKITFEQEVSEHAFEALRVYLGDHNADLVVMLERKRKGFLEPIFHRDRVKKMESYGRIPLMAFHEKNFQ